MGEKAVFGRVANRLVVLPQDTATELASILRPGTAHTWVQFGQVAGLAATHAVIHLGGMKLSAPDSPLPVPELRTVLQRYSSFVLGMMMADHLPLAFFEAGEKVCHPHFGVSLRFSTSDEGAIMFAAIEGRVTLERDDLLIADCACREPFPYVAPPPPSRCLPPLPEFVKGLPRPGYVCPSLAAISEQATKVAEDVERLPAMVGLPGEALPYAEAILYEMYRHSLFGWEYVGEGRMPAGLWRRARWQATERPKDERLDQLATVAPPVMHLSCDIVHRARETELSETEKSHILGSVRRIVSVCVERYDELPRLW